MKRTLRLPNLPDVKSLALHHLTRIVVSFSCVCVCLSYLHGGHVLDFLGVPTSDCHEFSLHNHKQQTNWCWSPNYHRVYFLRLAGTAAFHRELKTRLFYTHLFLDVTRLRACLQEAQLIADLAHLH